ncbi:zonular occludens toxin domain-containing protein [Saccharibacillus qingshengii]|uniref:zonular occludens toxin domain-containing protein n=1 Tax=Saccharibacillus qingshengii TaxID=1763540 RepID=UPI001556EF2E|nr:zonular occludens toxin domain-containing protein [Saccharibacillus qingshengii]
MALQLYSGSVGSGKSYHAVKDAIDKLSYRRKNSVVANFAITFSDRQRKKGVDKRFFYVEDEQLETPDYLMELSIRNGWVGKEGSALLILDEAAVYFNARDWNAKGNTRMKWIKFIVNSRKWGYDITFIAQEIRMMDRQMRSIIEHDVQHAKLNNFAWFKFLPLPVFVTIKKWLAADFKGQVRFHLLLPWVAKRYDTMKLFDPEMLAQMQKDLADPVEEVAR